MLASSYATTIGRFQWRYGRWILAVGLWGSLTFQLQNGAPDGNSSGNDSPGFAGCSGCAGVGLAAAVAKGGAILAKSGAALKGAAIAGGSTVSGRAGLKAAGRDFLKSVDEASLLRDTALLDDVPQLRQALNRGQSIEAFLNENPDAAVSVGLHLARRDPQAFARHLVDDIAQPARPRFVHVDDEQTKALLRPHADNISRDLEHLLALDARPIDHSLVLRKARLAAEKHSKEGADVSIVNDGLFLEIKIANGNHELTAKIDLATLSATGASGAITYDLKARDKQPSQPPPPDHDGNGQKNPR